MKESLDIKGYRVMWAVFTSEGCQNATQQPLKCVFISLPRITNYSISIIHHSTTSYGEYYHIRTAHFSHLLKSVSVWSTHYMTNKIRLTKALEEPFHPGKLPDSTRPQTVQYLMSWNEGIEHENHTVHRPWPEVHQKHWCSTLIYTVTSSALI